MNDFEKELKNLLAKHNAIIDAEMASAPYQEDYPIIVLSVNGECKEIIGGIYG